MHQCTKSNLADLIFEVVLRVYWYVIFQHIDGVF